MTYFLSPSSCIYMIICVKKDAMNEVEIEKIKKKIGGSKISSIFHSKAGTYVNISFYTHEQSMQTMMLLSKPKYKDKIQVILHNRHDHKCFLAVDNLPIYFDQKQLVECLSIYGEIAYLQVVRSCFRKQSNVAYVQYENVNDSILAYEVLRNCEIEGNKINVEFIENVSCCENLNVLSKLPQNVICVDGSSDLLKEPNLKCLFSKYGKIIDLFIVDNLGVVVFENSNSALRASS